MDRMLEDTIRRGALSNTLVWVGTVGGAFLLNLLLLIILAGR
jgi:hypothetical protein